MKAVNKSPDKTNTPKTSMQQWRIKVHVTCGSKWADVIWTRLSHGWRVTRHSTRLFLIYSHWKETQQRDEPALQQTTLMLPSANKTNEILSPPGAAGRITQLPPTRSCLPVIRSVLKTQWGKRGGGVRMGPRRGGELTKAMFTLVEFGQWACWM